jgi:copper resistance protein B
MVRFIRGSAPAILAALVLQSTSVTSASAQSTGLWATQLGTETLGGAAPYGNPISDDRTYVHGFVNQLEGRIGSGSYFRWDGQAWVGDDYNKLWLKSEGRYNAEGKGRVSDGDHELLYTRPLTTYFDMQVGVRSDIDSARNRTWAAFGVQGLAPGFWNVEGTVYASDGGHFALKTNAFYDLYITQRLVLQPQFETNWYTKTDYARGVGSGLSDVDAGLRLRYDFTRKFSPYIGVTYQRFFGETAHLRKEDGSKADDLRFVAGLQTWF